MHYHWGHAAAKKERGPFEQRTSSRKNRGTLIITNTGRFTLLLLNLVNLRDLFGVEAKLKEGIFKKKSQINFIFLTRT